MPEAEGKKLDFLGPETVDASELETFPYEGPRQRVSYTTDEFSAVCPFSGLPDLARVILEYTPRAKCIELKSLKYYYLSYRNVGIYQEAVTAKLYKDVWECLDKPYELKLTTIYKTRGGIDTVCSVSSLEN